MTVEKSPEVVIAELEEPAPEEPCCELVTKLYDEEPFQITYSATSGNDARCKLSA